MVFFFVEVQLSMLCGTPYIVLINLKPSSHGLFCVFRPCSFYGLFGQYAPIEREHGVQKLKCRSVHMTYAPLWVDPMCKKVKWPIP